MQKRANRRAGSVWHPGVRRGMALRLQVWVLTLGPLGLLKPAHAAAQIFKTAVTTRGKEQFEEDQKADHLRQRPASKASALAGNRLLRRRAEIRAGLYRPRQSGKFRSPAKTVSGSEISARNSSGLNTASFLTA